jgi:hypothetical protein
MQNDDGQTVTYADLLDAEERVLEAEMQVVRLERLVHVPGAWRCAKCNFVLIQSNLNAQDGTVTARDDPGDKCPNDGSPLWRVSYRDWCAEQSELAEQHILRLRAERDAALRDRASIVAWFRAESARHRVSDEKLSQCGERASADAFAHYAMAYEVAADAIEAFADREDG